MRSGSFTRGDVDCSALAMLVCLNYSSTRAERERENGRAEREGERGRKRERTEWKGEQWRPSLAAYATMKQKGPHLED